MYNYSSIGDDDFLSFFSFRMFLDVLLACSYLPILSSCLHVYTILHHHGRLDLVQSQPYTIHTRLYNFIYIYHMLRVLYRNDPKLAVAPCFNLTQRDADQHMGMDLKVTKNGVLRHWNDG